MTAAAVPTPVRREFIVNHILPAHLTHIIGGASGSGKTTLLFQLIDAVARGKQWFGYQCNPTPFAYISCDRTMAEVQSSQDRIKSETDIVSRSFSTVNESIADKFDVVYSEARRRWPDAKLIVIDGFGLLCEGRRSGDYPSYGEVARFLKGVTRRALADRTTIIGSDHDAKTKHGQGYDNPKDRILGSSAWAGFSSTVIHIDAVDPTNAQSPDRVLHIFPRDSVTLIHDIVFDDDGKLVPKTNQLSEFHMEQALNKLPVGEAIHRNVFLEAGDRKGIKTRTVDLWLSDAVKAGKLLKCPQRGYYQRLQTQ